MRLSIVVALIAFSTNAAADITALSAQDYKCNTTGGFFDFSPDGAIASCKEEIAEFCKGKGSPPVIGKIIGHPSGPARYARAEMFFQCMTEAELAQKEKDIAEKKTQQLKAEIQSAKQICQQDFGFATNTSAFDNCVLEMQKQNYANKRAEQEIAAQNEREEARLNQQRQLEADRNTLKALQSINDAAANNANAIRSNTNSIKGNTNSINCTSNSYGNQTHTSCY